MRIAVIAFAILSLLACTSFALPDEETVTLKDESLDELLLYPEDARAVLAVRCSRAELTGRGSRSERVALTTTVVAGDESLAGKEFLLTRYAQGDLLMEQGHVYLVAAHKGEWMPSWNLVAWVEVDAEGAEAAVERAIHRLAERPKP